MVDGRDLRWTFDLARHATVAANEESRSMQQKAITLAVVALLALGTSGVVAASITASPQAGPTGHSPSNDVSTSNHTVDVIDPNDRLTERDVTTAWQLAADANSVREHVDEDSSLHFQIEALGDELQVYVAPSEEASPTVLAVVDLESESIVSIEALDNVVQATETTTMEVSPAEGTTPDSSNDTTRYTASESVIVVSAEELIATQFDPENVTEVENGESTTVFTQGELSSEQNSRETVESGAHGNE